MSSAGSIYSHPSFDTEHLNANLLHCLAGQFMLKTARGANRLVVRVSHDLKITQVIGPVNMIAQTSTLIELELLRYDPNVSVTIFYRYVPPPGTPVEPLAHSFFQFSTHYSVPNDHAAAHTIWSHRIPHASEEEQFLESIDEDVLALSIAKLAVNHANAFDGLMTNGGWQ
jgi:hypothetical protein